MIFRKAPKVEGKILYHDLIDWWLTTFTIEERKYIDERYQPMNASPHSLTQGNFINIDREIIDTGLFLNGLATFFRSKTDLSILNRIYEKIDELGRTRPIKGVMYLRGRHYVTYVKDVKNLKREGKLEEAETLLLELVDIIENENKTKKWGVAPWYYEELAKIYRKNKEFKKEVSILLRYLKQPHGPGVKPKKLSERLEKAKILLEKNN